MSGRSNQDVGRNDSVPAGAPVVVQQSVRQSGDGNNSSTLLLWKDCAFSRTAAVTVICLFLGAVVGLLVAMTMLVRVYLDDSQQNDEAKGAQYLGPPTLRPSNNGRTAKTPKPTPYPTIAPRTNFPTILSPSGTRVRRAYGVDSNNDAFYIIDVDTGNTLQMFDQMSDEYGNYVVIGAMAKHPVTGRFYVWSNNSGLAEVNPRTGQATSVIRSSTHVPAMTFDTKGRLFGMAGLLYEIDIEARTLSAHCSNALPFRIYGATTDPDTNTIYGLEVQMSDSPAYGELRRLVVIDPVTCTYTMGARLSEDIRTVGALLWDSENQLIIGSSLFGYLFDIDPDTGIVSNIRSTSNVPQGMEWVEWE